MKKGKQILVEVEELGESHGVFDGILINEKETFKQINKNQIIAVCAKIYDDGDYSMFYRGEVHTGETCWGVLRKKMTTFDEKASFKDRWDVVLPFNSSYANISVKNNQTISITTFDSLKIYEAFISSTGFFKTDGKGTEISIALDRQKKHNEELINDNFKYQKELNELRILQGELIQKITFLEGNPTNRVYQKAMNLKSKYYS